MLAGMFLAIISYQYLFKQLLVLSDHTTKTEIVDLKQIKTTRTPIAKTADTLRTVVNKLFYEDGMMVMQTTKDTVYGQAGKVTLKPEVKIAKTVGNNDYWKMVFFVFIMILYVTMVYGPIAAFLVEMFPTKIRYTSMSLPYHIGNGVFGGLTPFIATLLTTIYTDDKLVGLMYPIIIASVCLVIGTLYINNKIHAEILE
jgi:hypothetical protein